MTNLSGKKVQDFKPRCFRYVDNVNFSQNVYWNGVTGVGMIVVA